MFANLRFFFLLLTALVSPTLNPAQAAEVTPSERGLIVLLNMHTGTKGFFLEEWYKSETAAAAITIAKKTKKHYGRRIFLYRDDAKIGLFLKAVHDLNADPAIKAIDLIVYVHGRINQLNFVYDGLGLLHSKSVWFNLNSVANRVKSIGSKKLRAVYSDACFGLSHTDEWLDAGFKVASGAIGVDGNQDRDLGLFLDKWVSGSTFRESLDFANTELTYPLFDRTLKDGNSFKLLRGDQNARIRQL